MKLRAEVLSERGKNASKSGNSFLILLVSDENREVIARIRFDTIGKQVGYHAWFTENLIKNKN